MSATDLLELAAGPLKMLLSPSIGGSISAFDFASGERSVKILRKCNSPGQNVLAMGNFPLVPFVNRIRAGRFEFRGRTVELAPNMAGDPSPLHGQGWLNPWTVESAAGDRATLTFVHAAGEWPWDYEARQEFVVDPDGLSLALSCRNISAEPMPCGLGQHPYFHCGAATRIDTRVSHVWTIDEHVLPVEKRPAEGRFDLAGRSVCGLGLDHGFGGWSGSALMTDPAWPFELALSSPNARFFQLYSPEDAGIFVAEPVTHANAALNAPEEEWADLGMQVLEPGAEMRLDMRLAVRAKP